MSYFCIRLDIDECTSNNGACDDLADCSNTEGGFTCTCQDGYTGDGFNCTGKLNSILTLALRSLNDKQLDRPKRIMFGCYLVVVECRNLRCVLWNCTSLQCRTFPLRKLPSVLHPHCTRHNTHNKFPIGLDLTEDLSTQNGYISDSQCSERWI